MRVLGLDTATWRASVGLVADGRLVAEKPQLTDGSHAVSLLPLIDEVLRKAGSTLDALDAIAVSGGPGSFTGLRVGLSVAKGLTRATGARLVTVPTLAALARTVVDHYGVIWSLLDARKGEIYAACFESSPDGCRRLTPDALLTVEALMTTLPTPSVVLGDAVNAYGDVRRSRLGDAVAVLPFDTHGPRGGVVALMGAEAILAGESSDLRSVEPFYVRAPEAERKFA